MVRLVVNDEGLRSYKAIAFIQNKSNAKNIQLDKKKKPYSKPRMSLNPKTVSSTRYCVEIKLNVCLNEKFGDIEWIN